MTYIARRSFVLLALMAAPAASVLAQATLTLPSPLSLADVVSIANERRDEIQTARYRGYERPKRARPSRQHLPIR